MNVYTKWKKYLETHKPSSLDMATYAIARSINSEHPLNKALHLLYSGFSPIKNTKKLLNGREPYDTLAHIVGSNTQCYFWSTTTAHKLIKTQLKDIFDIEDSDELTTLLNDISKNTSTEICLPYSYVIVRNDLTPAQKVVQSCHAIQEATMMRPDKHKDTRMIVLQVDNSLELEDIANKLKAFKRNNLFNFHMFYEDDNDVGHTAIATTPITFKFIRNFFTQFELLK